MRKNPISLLLSLSRQGPKSFSPLIYRNYASSSSSSPLDSPALSKLWTHAHGLLLKAFNKATPKRLQSTESSFVEKGTQLLLMQRKLKEKSELGEAFESAKTKKEMLNAFKKMESAFDERELAPACLRIGLKLKEDGEDPKQIISFANRALRGFDRDDEPAFLLIVFTLHLLGSAKYDFGGEDAFVEGLQYLERADRILGRLEREGCSDEDFRPLLYAVQFELANLKIRFRWSEEDIAREVIAHLRKCLEIKEVISEKDKDGLVGLGKANQYLAEWHVAHFHFKEALPHCMKALEIHQKELGQNSVEVASDRRLLGVIYTGLEKQNGLLRKVWVLFRICRLRWGGITKPLLTLWKELLSRWIVRLGFLSQWAKHYVIKESLQTKIGFWRLLRIARLGCLSRWEKHYVIRGSLRPKKGVCRLLWKFLRS